MPRPNFYMSVRDRKVLLDVISNYLGLHEDVDQEYWDGMEEEVKGIYKVRDKIRNMQKTKGYDNAVIKEALETAEKLKKEGKL